MRDRACRIGHRRRRRVARLRVRRAHRVSPAAYDRGAARDHRAGLAHPRAVPRTRRQGGAARRRHRPFGRRAAARRRGDLGPRQVQPHPRCRLRQPLRRRPDGRHQPGRDPGGRARRLLLRARPVEPDRLHHRRQRRRELGRRALPQVRRDDQQHPRRRDGADERRRRSYRRQAPRLRGLRPVGRHRRLGGFVGGDHRGHRAHPALTGVRAGAARRLPEQRGGGRLRRPRHRRRQHPRRHGDDGPRRGARGRGVLPRRLSARRRGAPDHRARRPRGRGRPPDRARPRNGRGQRRDHAPRQHQRGRARALLGRAQGGVPGDRPDFARLLLHGRHHPARPPARGADAHRRAVAEVRPRRRQRVPRRRRRARCSSASRRSRRRAIASAG